MSWTALVPLKCGDERKSRLAGRLTPEQRRALSEAMAGHVLQCLTRVVQIARVATLSPAPLAGFGWHHDQGRGLNAELAAYRAARPSVPLLVIHGDLPLVAADDIRALLAAAEAAGSAIAPDRHGSGTNALALYSPGTTSFAFGVGSRAAHTGRLGQPAIVERPGLAMDADEPGDLDAARAAGFDWA